MGVGVQAVEVKPFTGDFVEAATRVFVRAFALDPWNETWPASRARQRLSDIVHAPGFLGFAALQGEELVGFVLGRFEVYADEDHFYVQELCVAPEHQRQGIGTLMLSFLHKCLEAMGCRQVYLLTARESSVEQFYLRNGYGPAHRARVLVFRIG